MVSEELLKEFRKSFYLRLFQVISEKTQRRKNFVYNLRERVNMNITVVIIPTKLARDKDLVISLLSFSYNQK